MITPLLIHNAAHKNTVMLSAHVLVCFPGIVCVFMSMHFLLKDAGVNLFTHSASRQPALASGNADSSVS